MSKAKGKIAEPPQTPPPPIVFDALNSSANVVDSVIILSKSHEVPIVLKALHHLDSFASKFAGNVKILYDVGLLEAILLHLNSNHRFVRRFALKLAVAVFEIDEAREGLSGNDRLFEEAVRNYVTVRTILLNLLC